MPDLSPASMLSLSERMRVDSDLANTYSWNVGRHYGPKPTGNNNGISIYCNTSTSETYQTADCYKNANTETNSSTLGIGFKGMTGD